MKRILLAALVLITSLPAFSQAPPAEAQLPMILNVLPVMGNLDRAEEFYHRLLGLESTQGDPRARLAWYPNAPFLQDMYAVKGNTRNFFLKAPNSELTFELESFDGTQAKRLDTHIQDPGAMQFIFATRDVNQLTAWITKGGAKVYSAGGKPVSYGAGVIATPNGPSRPISFQAVEFDDFNGFFVRLVQLGDPAAGTGAPAAFISSAALGATVEDTEKTAKFYHDILGLDVELGKFSSDAKLLESFGLKDAQVRESVVKFADPKAPPLWFFEFKGVDRKPLHPAQADPNSVLIRIAVHDLEGIMAKVKAAGGQIMNASGGITVNGRTHWLVVKDPNGIHLQLLERQ
jgi:predicted enzyme related to lactoylglutathione lyase